MKRKILLILLISVSISFFGQNKDLNIDFMLRGTIYAKSSIIDTLAFGGFGESDNSPKELTDSFNFEGNGICLYIDTAQIVTFYQKYNGYKFYIINKTGNMLKFSASESRLNVVAEAFFDKKWQPIEYLPSSWCGNSYHTMALKNNEYWEFTIPKFSGKTTAKIRYKLTLDDEICIYSNEINTKINKAQATNKKKYYSRDMMDPYDE
jgi:hypothetical protein